MRLFHHHVGRDGAQRDFPRTVDNSISIDTIEEVVRDEPCAASLVRELRRAFPEGRCNVWGAPGPAELYVRQMKPGDIVFLRASESFTAYGEVRVFLQERLDSLSVELWGEARFPWIFFFETRKCEIPWTEFKRIAEYSEKYRTNGRFYSISNAKTTRFGGPEALLQKLLESCVRPINGLPLLSIGADLDDLDTDEAKSVTDELHRLLDAIAVKPPDSEPSQRTLAESSKLVRDRAFAILVKALYDHRCALCGSSIVDPKGHAEVEAAHVRAVFADGPHHVRNGVALCRTHHWAYDRGCYAVTDDLKVITKATALRSFEGASLASPVLPAASPAPTYLQWHRRHHGFE